MKVKFNNQKFPRKLTGAEKKILFSILPDNKPGYKIYREKIDKLFVIGYGRFGETNLVLGRKESKPDFSVSSTPVFAIGTVETNLGTIDVIIHEESDDEIEFDITGPELSVTYDQVQINSCKTYSGWIPGLPSPIDGSDLREVVISTDRFVLAISPVQKKIWLFEYDTGVNRLIPLTNFYNELMRVKNIRDPERALKPGSFFNDLNLYSDSDLKTALLKYDKYMHKLKLPFDIKTDIPGKSQKGFINILGRGKN